MAAEEYRQLFDYLDEAGQEWRVSKEREEEFRRAHPEAKKFVRHFTPDGQEWRVGVDKVDAFRREHADAEPAYPIAQGGEIRNVRRSELPETIDRAAGPSDSGRSPLAEGARAAGRVLAALPAGAVNKVKESYAALTAGDEARRERAKAERAAPERIPTLKEAAKKIGLKPEEIEKLPDRLVTLKDLEDPRFGQAYRDSVRATMNRVAANAPETAEEKKHLEKAEKAQERYERLAKPVMEAENGVERALQTVGHGAGTVAEFAAANALAPGVGGNALMFAEGAANAAAAAEAQGKSASDAMALGIPAGLAEAAVWAAPTPGVEPGRLRVGSNGFGRLMRDVHVPAALRGAAGEAVVAGAKTDLSGVARRAVTGEEAPELRERLLEDLGGAAFGGVMGAVRGAQEARAERAGSAARTRLRQERRDAMQDLIAEQTQLREDNLAGRNGMEARVAERARVDAVYGYDPATPGERLPVESLEGAGRVAGYSGPRIRDTGRGEPEIVGPLGTEGARRPWADKIGPRLPETEEGVIEARRAALAALPPKERMARTSHETYFREHEGQSPVLETIGVKRFLELRRKFKNDFRDITGEKDFKPEEVAAELGRDPKDATAQSLLEEAAEEYARYERWRNELGAPDAELEAGTGREAEWNRQQNDRAVDEAKRRWEETHPDEAGEPPLTERDLAGREAAQEQDFVERMESGEPEVPPAEPPQAPIPDEFAPRPAEPRPAEPAPAPVAESATPPPPEPAPAAPEPTRRAAASPQQQAPALAVPLKEAVKDAAAWAVKQREVKAVGEEASNRLDAFFEPGGENSEAVPVSKLFTNKLDEPRSSIDTARQRMEASAAGKGQKRAPISVVANEDGTYTVVDGNATANALLEMGEQNARVNVVGRDKGTILRNSGLALEEVGVKDENGNRITLKTEGIDADPKSKDFRESAYKQAEENEPQLRNTVQKAGIDLGLSLNEKDEQVVMRGKNKPGPGVDPLEENRPVKKRKRVDEKTEDDYDGNYDQVVDLIGGSLVLPDGMRYGDAVKAIERNLPDGAKIAKVKKCNIDDDLVGYHDMKVSIRFKNGGIGEVIVVEQYLNDIKFHKGGHEIYDRQRFLEGLLRKAKKGKIHLDPDVADRILDTVEDLKELSNATYARGPAAAEAAASFDSMKAKASASLQGLMSEKRLMDLLSEEDTDLLKSFDRASQTLVPPSLDEYAMPKRSLIQNDISAPPSSRGATTAPTSENLPQRAPEVNPPRAGAQAAPAQAAPGLAAPAAPEGGSRRPGVGGGVVTPPPPGSVQARLEGMLAVDGADAPLTPERSGEYRALADEAGRSGNYATRARALQRLGEFEGLPADHPEAARSLAEHEAGKPLLQLMQLPDLVEIARTLGHGSDPKVKRVLSPGWAAGLFRPEGGRGGVPIIEVLGKLHQVVPQTERQRLANEAHLDAVRRLGPDAKAKAVKALEAEIYGRKFEDAWNDALARGPGQAMNVLAHEIGHWIDYLPDHIQKRGNILGHLAALDKWAKGWIAAEPGQKGKHADVIAAGDAAEAKVLRQPAEPLERFMDRRAKARSAAEEKAALARGFLMKRDVERELSDLVAWYRCSDGLPDYFKDPGELFAEAFSAYCNAPATTRAKAPKFAAALDGWLAERPEAQRAVFEGRARAEKLAAQALRTGKAAPDLDFFGRLQESIAAGTLARQRAAEIRAQRQPKGFKLWQRDVVDDVLQIMEDRHAPLIRRAREVGEWSDPLADELLGALNRFEKAASAHEAELFRFRTEVLPIVEGLEGQQAAFAEYLIVNRIANEVLGKEMDRGRMNLANPEGITPGSSRTPQWGATAQARLKWIQENQPAQWAKLKKAQAALVEIRRGRDHSVLAELRDSGLIRPDAMKEIWDNTDYAAFRRQLCLKDVAPPKIAGRALGEMSTWSGVYKQVTGGYGPVEDPVLATLAGDAMILKLARLNSVRRAAANFLRFHFPDETREVAPDRWHTNSHGEKIPDQTIDGDWRTIVWKENGETRALDVRRRYADPLAKDERLDPDAIERTGRLIATAARGWSMAMAAANYAFSVKNVPRDKQAVASAMPAKKGARLSNAFGDWGTAMRALVSGHGENREKGLHPDENLLLALETGALPPDVQGGYMAVARGDRLSPLYGPDTPERQAAIRGIIERAGLDPSIEKERSVVAKLFHSFWGRYQQPLNFLGRQESNNKVQAMMEIRAAHPDWSQNRVAWYVSHYVGTPDPTFRPYVADHPMWNLFVPFWTMTAHGNFDQIYRLRWKEQRGVSAIRYGTHAIAKFAFNFSKGAILVGLAKNWAKQAQEADDGTDEGKARAAHLRSLSAMADDFGEMQEAIPVHDRFNSLCIPLAWADREAHKVWYLRLPSDQTITPIDAAAMGAFAIHAKQADFGDIFDGSLSTTMPMPLVGRLGPLPNAIYGALNGVDTGRGFKSIDSPDAVTLMDKIPARALWALKTAGVNVAGLWTKAPWAPADVGENVDALERFLRIPGFNATFGSFLRCSNGGRKSMAHQLDVKETARQARERQLGEKAEQGDESALGRLRESGADVGAVLDRARKRRLKHEMYRDPLERTALKFGRKELVRIRSGDDW